MDPISLEAMAQAVPDGALVALPPDNSLPSVSLAKALIRRGARGLRLLGVPVSGFATDILIGAGCVAEVRDQRRQPRRGRLRPALLGRGARRHAPRAGRHLPGDPHHAAGGGEGRALHAAARA